MKLRFRVLVIDDDRGSATAALGGLEDFLRGNGFTLETHFVEDLSDKGIRRFAAQEGRNYDLVMVDYNLGRDDTNGASAAASVRRQLAYTDIIFYSSMSPNDLGAELAKQQVPGVFVANRTQLGEALEGVTKTIIGKAIDLTHMRGIAMAEVADMDVLMEETLARVFACEDDAIKAKAGRTLKKLVEDMEADLQSIKPIVADGRILDAVGDSRLFGSAQKCRAIQRVLGAIAAKPEEAAKLFATYEKDVLGKRNTLAHAKEEAGDDGATALRSSRRGEAPVIIDDAWMADFRRALQSHRQALGKICGALSAHVDGLGAK